MFKVKSSLSLRNLLLADATTCIVMGAFLTAGAAIAGRVMQLPAALLFYAGLSLFPVAVFMTIVATRRAVQPVLAWLIIVGNILWVGGSFLLLAGGWIAPNYLGTSFIVAQALVVAAFARLEHAALHDASLRPA